MSRQIAALRERITAVPVVKSGLSLMTGTIVTALLGLIFWIIAAKLFDQAAFGVGTTVVYTMMTLAEVACIGLRTGLLKYTPRSGGATIQVIVWGYALAFTASAITAMIFLLGLGWWAPDLVELRNTALMFGFFVLSTAFWALFMLQDSVLVGLRKAPWVPVENSIFGVLKILLLFPLAAWSPTLGIFWAWTLPVFPIVFGINFLVRGVAKERQVDAPTFLPDTASFRLLLREMMSFSIAEWLASVSRLAALGIIPLMVLAEAGKAQAGYFQASWLIAFTIFQLSSNAAYALLAENSYEESSLQRNSIQAGLLSLALSAPGIAIGVIGAPLLLLIYGSDYADNSSSVMRVLLIAALPNIVHQIYIGRLRSQGKMLAVVVLETTLSVLVIGLSALLLPRQGIIGVGYAWLAGLTALALYAAAAESSWWWAARLNPRIVRFVGAVVARMQIDRPVRGMERRLTAVLEGNGIRPGETTWLQPGVHGQAAVVKNAPGSELVVEFARSETGAQELARRCEELELLRAEPRLASMDHLIPEMKAKGQLATEEYVVWTQPVGKTAKSLVTAGTPVEEISRLVFDAMSPLRTVTAQTVIVDGAILDEWISPGLAHLALTGRGATGQLAELRSRLEEGLAGSQLVVGRVHGELALDNIIMAEGPPRLVGLVRWELTRRAPLILDAASLALSDLVLRDGGELGSVVADLLQEPAAFEDHPAMLLAAAEGFGTARHGGILTAETALLLSWLFLVGRPLPPGRTVSSDEVWLARNAQPVLAKMTGRQGASS